MDNLTVFKKSLNSAPDSDIDPSMKELISKWSEPPKSIEVLEVIDHSVYSSLMSGPALAATQVLYDLILKQEGKTHEDNLPLATWRD